GKRLACLSIPRKGSHMDVFNLAVVTLGDGGTRTEVLFNHHGPGAKDAPHPAPSFPLPEDCWDGNDARVYHAATGTATATVRVDLKTGKGAAFVPTVKPGGPQPAAHDLAWRLHQARQLTPPGNLFLRDRLHADSRVVTWDNGEGRQIEGVLTVP